MDDLYPNDGTHFEVTVPAEQVQEESAEKAKMQEGITLLEELIEEYKKDEKFYDSISSIRIDPKTRPEEFQQAWFGQQKVKEYIAQKKDYLEGLRSQYSR